MTPTLTAPATPTTAAGSGPIEGPAGAGERDSGTVRRLRTAAHVVLAVVAVIGAALSYTSLQAAAAGVFHGSVLAYGFPLLVDALILGASLQYVAGSREHTPGRTGWRATAHAGIAATLLLNALAAYTPTGGGTPAVPWHITAPAVWAVLVELYARTAAGHWSTEHLPTGPGIPARLWITAPVESARTWLRQARLTAAVTARYDVGRHAAALEALRLTLPGRTSRRVRAVLRRQLRAGSLTPDAVLAACGWHHLTIDPVHLDPHAVLRTALAGYTAHPSGDHLGADPVRAPEDSSAPRTPLHECTRPIPDPISLAGTTDEYAEPIPPPAPAVTRPAARAVAAQTSTATRSASTAAVDPAHTPQPSATADPADAEILAAILATGSVPSVRAIKTTHRVGQDRAARIRAHAAAQLDRRNPPNPVPDGHSNTAGPRQAASPAVTNPTSPEDATSENQEQEDQTPGNRRTPEENTNKTPSGSTPETIKTSDGHQSEETPGKAREHHTNAVRLM